MQAGYGVTLYDVTPTQAITKINRRAEWWNGGWNGRMVGMAVIAVIARMAVMAGMAERMAEWQKGRHGYIHTIYGTH